MNVLRCECSTRIASADDDELVALAAEHAWRVHGMQLTRDLVLANAEPDSTVHRAGTKEAETDEAIHPCMRRPKPK